MDDSTKDEMFKKMTDEWMTVHLCNEWGGLKWQMNGIVGAFDDSVKDDMIKDDRWADDCAKNEVDNRDRWMDDSVKDEMVKDDRQMDDCAKNKVVKSNRRMDVSVEYEMIRDDG